MKAGPFVIGGQRVSPGERRTVSLSLPGFYTLQDSISMSVHVVHGRRPGPVLFVCAAVHGDELNGVEILRRTLRRKAMSSLRGTLLAVPVVNVFGIVQHSRYLPDGRDLNRSFPGSESGSLASRLANIFIRKVVMRSDYGIDLHTGSRHRTNLPQVRADFSQPETLDIAKSFGVPVVIDSPLCDGSLRETAGKRGIPLIVYEAGEALRFDDFSIRSGTNGIINVLRHLSMLPKPKPKKPMIEPYIADSSSWLRAPASGILNQFKRLGDRVHEGERIGQVSDPTDMFTDTATELISPFGGIVIGHTRIPLVNEGDAVFHIARFDNAGEVAEELEQFQDETMDLEQ